MMFFHRTALFAALTLALSAGAWAERGGHHNHGDSGYRDNGGMRQVETRGNGGQQSWRDGSGNRNDLRPAYRDDDRMRERYRDDDRYRDRHDSGYGRSYGGDGIYQRFHGGGDRGNESGYYRRGGQRPVNDVIREVQDRYGGQVIGVQNSEGGSMYRVRVLQRDGRVKNVMVPAE